MAHRGIEIGRRWASLAGPCWPAYVLLPLLAGTTACSRLHPRPALSVYRATAPVHIDARLEEAVWAQAQPAEIRSYNPAVQTGPFPSTRVRLCWDPDFLYIALQGEDTETVAEYTRRDDPIYNEEVMEIMLSPYRHRKQYYEFSASPRGTLYDASVFSPQGRRKGMMVEPAWNAAGWITAVKREAERWTVEMAIPFSCFEGVPPPRAGDRWYANFFRIELKPHRLFGSWSPTFTPVPDFHRPGRFGVLKFTAGTGRQDEGSRSP